MYSLVILAPDNTYYEIETEYGSQQKNKNSTAHKICLATDSGPDIMRGTSTD